MVGATLVLTLSSALVPSAVRAEGSVTHAAGVGLRARALRAYQQKNYELACPLYERAAEQAQTDGALWSDLGLCQFHRQKLAEGRRASLLAIRYGNPQVRKATYHNLDLFGAAPPLLEKELKFESVVCGPVARSPVFACAADPALWACIVPFSSYGSGGGEIGSSIFFGYGPELQESFRAQPEMEGVPPDDEKNALRLSYALDTFCGYCHMHAWSCNNSSHVNARAAACFKKLSKSGNPNPNLCPGRNAAEAARCGEWNHCFDEACQRAQAAYDHDRSLWPAAANEITAAYASCASCGVKPEESCKILAVDRCGLRVGYVCEEGQGKTRQVEYRELELDAETL